MSNVLMNIDKTRSMSFDLDIILTKHADPKYDKRHFVVWMCCKFCSDWMGSLESYLELSKDAIK